MGFQDSSFWKWWNVYGKHIEAVVIIILFITVILTYNTNTRELKYAKENHPCIFETKLIEDLQNLNVNPPVEDFKISQKSTGYVKLVK